MSRAIELLRRHLAADLPARHAARWRRVETSNGPALELVKHDGRWMDRNAIHDEIRGLILAVMRLERMEAQDEILARYDAACCSDCDGGET